jgi:cytochrome c
MTTPFRWGILGTGSIAKQFAKGLAEPLGIKVVNGEIYVLQFHELTKLVDTNKDGLADEFRSVCNSWPATSNFHEFAFGLVYRDGFFYANLAVAINPGGENTVPQATERGSTIRIDPKTGTHEIVASGLRTPNGIGLLSDNSIWITDNQGDWLPSSTLMKLVPGAFYGAHKTPDHPAANQPETPPVAWLPQGEIGNSPSQPTDLRVGPWKGQILHGDVIIGLRQMVRADHDHAQHGHQLLDDFAAAVAGQGGGGGAHREYETRHGRGH